MGRNRFREHNFKVPLHLIPTPPLIEDLPSAKDRASRPRINAEATRRGELAGSKVEEGGKTAGNVELPYFSADVDGLALSLNGQQCVPV